MKLKKDIQPVEEAVKGIRLSQKNEIVGLVSIGISMLLIIAFVFRTGVVMQFIASSIEKAFGLGIYIISAWLFVAGIEKIKGNRVHNSRYEILGWLILFFSFMVLASVFFAPDYSAGGMVGKIGVRYFTMLFGKIGSYVFLVILFLVSFILAFDITLKDVAGYFKKIILDVFSAFVAILRFSARVTILLFSPVQKTLLLMKKGISRVFSKFRQAVSERRIPAQDIRDSRKEDTSELSRINIIVDGIPLQDKDAPHDRGKDFDSCLKNTESEEFEEKYVQVDENEFVHQDDLEEYTEELSREKPAETKREKPSRKAVEKVVSEPEVIEKQGTRIEPVKENYSEKVIIRDNSFLPKVEFLNKPEPVDMVGVEKELEAKAQIVIQTLSEFNIPSEIIGIVVGPSVTRIEITIAPGIKVAKIKGLSEDIGLKLATKSIRIEAPIPGKSTIGIEIPNTTKVPVFIREIIDNEKKPVFRNSDSILTMALGKTISGDPVIGNLGKMPHLLVAGSTGSGKSVCINSIILSFLYKATSDKLKLLMIDPKMVELAVYDKIPHLLHPVVTDPIDAATILNWAVQEMERRYFILSKLGVRQLDQYNKLVEDFDSGLITSADLPLDDDGNCYFDMNYPEKMPPIVLIIDELADLMMVAKNTVEDSICRLLQKSRAIGIHLIIATQRPSVDVITGLLKANLPSRIAFRVSSGIDSRTILDRTGAEGLLGWGDMLYLPVGKPSPIRLQGCYVDDREIKRVVDFLKSIDKVEYDSSISNYVSTSRIVEDNSDPSGKKISMGNDGFDDLFPDAVAVVMETNYGSTSMIQRKLKVGYARAGRLMDILEQKGVIGPRNGSKPRDILVSQEEADELVANYGIEDE